jgi:DNA-binding MarR family transcriptional regulator
MATTTTTRRSKKILTPGQPLPRATRRVARNGAAVHSWGWKIPKAVLVQTLQAGGNLAELARRYGCSRSTASRAVRSLSVAELSSLVLGKSPRTESLGLPAPDLQSPIDIQQEAVEIGEDLPAMRAWLMSDEAKAALRTPTRVTFVISLFDKRINWVNSFLSQREKMLKMLGTDAWIHELFAMLDEEDDCPHCHQALQQKARIMERIRRKLMGYDAPILSVPAPRDANEEPPFRLDR